MKHTLMIISLSGLVALGFSSCKEELCSDTCHWAGDNECDDGGEGSINDYCDFGTDCTDCGTRTE